MIGFNKIKKEIKDHIETTGNPYLTPSDIDRGKWCAGASHCTIRKLMLAGKIPSIKIGIVMRAHYLDVIEYLKQCYQTQNLTSKKQNYEEEKNDNLKKESQNFEKNVTREKKSSYSDDSYYQNHKKEIREKQKDYYQKNKEKMVKQAKEYYNKNKNFILEKNKNSEIKGKYDREYYFLNKDTIKERKRKIYQLKKVDYDK